MPKSPLASKGFHAKHTRLLPGTSAGASASSRYLKSKRPPLATILEEDEEQEDVYVRPQPRRDLHVELDRLSRRGNNNIEDDDDMDWDEENTLVALLQDEYVSSHPIRTDIGVCMRINQHRGVLAPMSTTAGFATVDALLIYWMSIAAVRPSLTRRTSRHLQTGSRHPWWSNRSSSNDTSQRQSYLL